MDRNTSWKKNLLFVSLIMVGVSSLAYFLMATEQIVRPKSFSPTGPRQLKIAKVANQVDAAFTTLHTEKEIEVAAKASNLQIARRLALGLAGTIPSLEEIREFENQPEDQQIHWWVSRLLEARRTSNHLAERFTRAFVGVEEGPFLVFRRRRFASWLSDELYADRRYDSIVKDILTDEGLWTDTPSVNFYTRTINDETQHPDPILLAGRTSRAFLGMRIDCLQCHDDFLGSINLGSRENLRGGMQTDFHSLAAFFAETETSVLGIRDKAGRGPYMYRLLDRDDEEAIPAVVPFNSNLDAQESNLRRRLANWVTHPDNRPFARATVNRVWAIMCGRPLITPVDDIPLEGPFPLAMEILVDDFIANDFRLKHLIRVIAQTEAFQRDSTIAETIQGKHENAWAVFPMVQLRPDQVAGAIIQSTKLTTIDSTSHIITQLTKFGEEFEFVTRFGDPGEDEFDDHGETVTQRLLMLNGNMINDRLKNGINIPVHLNLVSPNVETSIETVYLTTLTRRPTNEELNHFQSTIKNVFGRERANALIDLYWTLLNSAEFRWNH
jgi:hypothetical protein